MKIVIIVIFFSIEGHTNINKICKIYSEKFSCYIHFNKQPHQQIFPVFYVYIIHMQMNAYKCFF